MSHPFSGSRLREEVRSACREALASGPTDSVPAPHRLILGEWLGIIRQPREGFSPRLRPRRGLSELDEPRGDLSRTHIMRLKGERAHLDDGVTRSSRFSR